MVICYRGDWVRGGASTTFENAGFTNLCEKIEKINKLFLLDRLGVHLYLKISETQKCLKMELRRQKKML